MNPQRGRGVPRESLEFSRVANLSDGVFAIAMTLMVLGLEVPRVEPSVLGAALEGTGTNLVAFFLAFALVANIWWQHHRFFARLAWLPPGLIGLNLVLLCAVAVVPFPTALLGNYPTSRAAVLPFIVIFGVLHLLFLALNAYAQRVEAWQRPMPPGLFTWVMAGWGLSLAVVAVAGVVATFAPLAGLLVLVLGNVSEPILVRTAPSGYRDWS